MMTTPPWFRFAQTLLMTVALGACTSGFENDPGQAPGPDGGVAAREGCGVCEPDDCGFVPDGCGGELDCGVCEGDGDCTPVECSGSMCGMHFDGCVGQLDCGACDTQCVADGFEQNDTPATAADLGEYDDKDQAVPDLFGGLTLGGDDVDYYTAHIKDTAFLIDFNNAWVKPIISTDFAPIPLHVKMTFVCDDDKELKEVTCRGSSPISGGCEMSVFAGALDQTMEARFNCKGANDSGTITIEVRPDCASGTCGPGCQSYDLAMDVD